MIRPLRYTLLFSLLAIAISYGCQTTYYAVWEKLGKEKRHLLKDHVEKARTEQEKASEEFKDALTRVKEIYGLDGGDLEEFYHNNPTTNHVRNGLALLAKELKPWSRSRRIFSGNGIRRLMAWPMKNSNQRAGNP